MQFSSWPIGSLAYEYSYTTAGRIATQRLQVPLPAAPAPHLANLDATYQWDPDGRMTALSYPSSAAVLSSPPAYAYTYDSMGHLGGMTENGTPVASAGYNWATDQLTSMSYDSFSETPRVSSAHPATQPDQYEAGRYDRHGHDL